MDDRDLRFGGLNMVFAGDFSQMEPVKREPVFRGRRGKVAVEFHHFVNAFVELDGMHRFKDDVEWGQLLIRIQDGTVTVDDLKHINEHCVVSDTHTNHHKVCKLQHT